MSDRPSVIVVGAGVFGASAAWRLVQRGWDVTLVEAVQPGHVRASSGGRSRLIRHAHGDDVWHTRSVVRALDGWEELEDVTGQSLLVRCGVAWFAREERGWEAAAERVLRGESIEVERLTPDDATGLYPSLRTDDLAFVLFEPTAGVLRAARAVRALSDATIDGGAILRPGVARPDGATVVVEDERLDADAVVWACGPWLPTLFPELVTLRVTRQEVAFFGVDHHWRAPGVPAWVDHGGAAYGVGDLDGDGFKCAPDEEGDEVDPDTQDRRPHQDAIDRARDRLAGRFPHLADAPVVQTRVCQYSLTPDTRFIAAPHPEHDGVWIVGGGSGHGFKHGPAMGDHVADLVEGKSEPDPSMGLGDRRGDTKLRTAGADRTAE